MQVVLRTQKDSDSDGIPDDADECPFTAGLVQFNGCPDTDGDGVMDKIDSCPTTPGPANNKGCPVIEKADKETLDFAMRAVQFDLGRATLKTESFNILDKVAKIMKNTRIIIYPLRVIQITREVLRLILIYQSGEQKCVTNI